MKNQLSTEQIDDLKMILLKRQELLSCELNSEKAPPTPMESESQDMETVYINGIEKEVSSEIEGQHRTELYVIEQALQLIESGRYGKCIDCENDIGFERLSVYPAAKRCLECKQKYEQTEANK